MKCIQKEILLKERSRGFHLITDEIENNFSEIREFSCGTVNVFIKHTSASLSINENADPDVRKDLETHFNLMVPENADHYRHTAEGPDDMTSHIKSSILGCSLVIPVTNGRFSLGTWQGIYLCEHRNSGGRRKLVITVTGDISKQ
ncbi:MAG TPA: secondary thiamine-phosphate synthase enzyme YjbQ [Ignavibacteria bacterium]|nr:secondary thiamine-phosphate synthase enzyme YjbQ [Ignavibacteria bacterium]